jgi:hypothetical protein
MARVRGPRDYAVEQRRRNELAVSRGYTSRAQQRRAIETGRRSPLRPDLLKSPRTIEAQRIRSARVEADLKLFGQYAENERWAKAHAVRHIGRFDPRERAEGGNRLPGVSLEEFSQGYNDAFVNGPLKYRSRRNRGGSRALRRYFVDLTGHFTADEYEARYGHVR